MERTIGVEPEIISNRSGSLDSKDMGILVQKDGESIKLFIKSFYILNQLKLIEVVFLENELGHHGHALAVADHIGLKSHKEFHFFCIFIGSDHQNLVLFVLDKIFIVDIGHTEESLVGIFVFIVINSDVIKIVQNLVVLDQTSFIESLFGLLEVGDVELVQRLDLKRLVLIDDNGLRFSVISSSICDIVVGGFGKFVNDAFSSNINFFPRERTIES